MSDQRTRAFETFPTVLLTVLGIIQALVLEFLWEKALRVPELWSESPTPLVGWLQCLANFLGVIVIWITYSSIVLRVRWTPNIRDLVVPFVIGVMELILIELIDPETVDWWLVGMGLVFGFVTWGSYAIYNEAGLEASRVRWARLSGYVAASTSMLVLLLLGALVRWAGADGGFAVAAVSASILALGVQLGVLRRFWVRDLRPR